VPGNHDIDRRSITALAANTASLLNSRDAVNAVLSNPVDCTYIGQRLRNYVQFVRDYLGDLIIPSMPYPELPYYMRSLNLFGKSIRVLGLNSAWMCTGDDRGNLLIGERQVRDVVDKVKGADLTITLMHHPFDWLKEFDADDTQALLEQESNFILRGHLHKTRLELTSSPDAKVMHIAAGALYETRQSPNAYNIVRLGEGEGIIYFRRYSDEAGGFFAADTLTYKNAPIGEYTFALWVQPHSKPQLSINEFLSRASVHLLNQTGNKRTAYPTDMNFRELFEKQVYIPPRFFPINGADSQKTSSINLENILDQISNAKNLLVLGEPGSGKSFFTYLIQRRMAQTDSTSRSRICLPIDLRLFIDAVIKHGAEFDLQRISQVLQENYPERGFDFSREDSHAMQVFFIVDGIDELTSNPSHVNALPALLHVLGKLGNILVTCRTQDFEYVFAPHIDPSLFDMGLRVKEWEVESEFSEFVRKLESAGLFVDNGLLDKVKTTPAMRALVRRPLHARMLTFVSKSGLQDIPDISRLYWEYLYKYATVVDSRLLRETCLQKPETYLLWRESAWHVFQANLFIHDKLPLEALSEFLIRRHGVRPSCIRGLLYPLFNFVQVFQSTQLQFIHYSFFEYLVAEFMADALVRSFLSESVDIYQYFQKDMTPEVRHHLMRIINRTTPTGFAKWLAKGYLAINKAAPNQVRRKVANNLLVYILGRLNEDVGDEMWALLKSEADDFLRTCLYWGLCAVVGSKAVHEYIEVLRSSAQMRYLNQGYLLYYYGDLDRSKDPPYLDNDASISWANTKLRNLEFMAEPDYHHRIPIGRRAIDLYTFYDFCLFRNEVISGAEASILATVLNTLKKGIKDEYITLGSLKSRQVWRIVVSSPYE